MKAYLMLGLFFTGLLAGWFARGWYEDSKKADALEIAIERGNKQTVVDRELQDKTLEAQRNVQKTFEALKTRPVPASGCIIGTELVQLWNAASRAANAAGAP